MNNMVGRALRQCRKYADGGAVDEMGNPIVMPSADSGMEQLTQPIRDFSDRTGNTQFWRGVMGGEYPGLALGAQFVGRAPVRGTAAYDQAMMRVLDRRAGGEAFNSPRMMAATPEDAAVLSRTAQRLPPIRDIDMSEVRGLQDARYPTNANYWRPHAWQTHMRRAANNPEALTPYDRAYLNELMAQQARQGFRIAP